MHPAQKLIPALLLSLGLAASAPWNAASAAEPVSPVAIDESPQPLTVEALGIEVRLPALDNMQGELARRDQMLGSWRGTLEGTRVDIVLLGLSRQQFGGMEEPDQAVDLVVKNQLDDRRRGPTLEFEALELLPGPFGWVPYGALVRGHEVQGTQRVAEQWILAGTVPDTCYIFDVRARGILSEEARQRIESFLREGVSWAGEARDPRWTQEEIDQRWRAVAPENIPDRSLNILRTDNYIIFTNSGGGRNFAQVMEANYKLIRAMYPFPEVEGRRLMPVFLFRLNTEYYEFFEKIAGIDREGAARSKGHASRDYYATWYEAPRDPVHIHEATHQIFMNRLLLTGGGSWFQEGVAEYMEGDTNRYRNFGRAAARRGEYLPFRQFFTLPSLLYSSDANNVRGGSAAGDAYTQAATVIAFVRENRATRDKFQQFVHAIGSVRRSDLGAIERELQRLFGVDIDGFEELWLAHWRR